VRLRALLALLMPTTVALLIGVVVGTYVIAPIVEPGAAAETRQPGASSGQAGSALSGIPAGPPSGSAREPSPGPSDTTGPAAGPTTKAGSPQASGGPRPSTSPAAAAKEGVVPILYYHRVENIPAGFATWSKGRQDAFLVDDTLPFALVAQLDWLVAHGYTTILPRDLAAHWDAGKALPARPIMLTFDDGFADWRSFVLPQLLKRHMVAEFYVVIENVGRSISWADVRAIARAGMGIGAHDVQHVELTGGGVRPYSPAVMRYQVTEAKRRLEAETGVRVDSMAYVGGGFDATLMAIVKQAGYTTARSIERGVLQTRAIRFHLHVSRVGWRDDVTDLYNARLAPGLPTFAKRVSGANPG
jgi:peptidoglycan/xylan/chitin deacetylase (PgdA/CDA1 family)